MAKNSTKRQKKKAEWDAIHGLVTPAVEEALRLGGVVARIDPAWPKRGGEHNGNGGSKPPAPPLAPPAPAGDDSLDRPPLDRREVLELQSLAALGEMTQFRQKAERLFVQLATQILNAEGGAYPLGALVADCAYALDVSTETIKRYLRKHASRWGEFLLEGEMVLLRRGR